MNNPAKTLIVIAGPTASGKTELAILLARYFNTEIISADSRQFYREIPLGTAAPTAEQRETVPHHFVGHLSIRQNYNVSSFEKDVLQLLEIKFKKLNTIIMVGGSGLYINAVCKGIDDLPDPDAALRASLDTLYQKKGIGALQEKLATLDPAYYRQVDKNNPKRLIRAIEVCLQTGKTYSELRKNKAIERDFSIIKIGLDLPRKVLNERINRRTDSMLQQGWLEEGRSVYPLRDQNALNTVGFKELYAYLDGTMDWETAVEKIKTNTRRYAKRQMTWFRKDKEIQWFHPDQPDQIISFIESKGKLSN